MAETESDGKPYAVDDRFFLSEAFILRAVDVACLIFLSVLDWSAFSALFASTFWHLLNAFNLGFNFNFILGILLGFIIIPPLFLFPPIWKRLLRNEGLIVSRLLSLLFITAATQVDQFSRTIFLAIAVGCFLARLFQLSGGAERLSWAAGFATLFVIRWSLVSMNPLEVLQYWLAPFIMFFVGILCISRIHYTSNTLSRYSPHEFVAPYPAELAKSRPLRVAWAILAVIATASFLFLLPLAFGSASILVRWNGLKPYPQGLCLVFSIVAGFLALACSFSLESPSRPRWWPLALHLAAWVFVLVGGALAIALRGSVGGFVGGCLLAVGILPTAYTSIEALQCCLKLLVDRRSFTFSSMALGFCIESSVGVVMLIFFLVQLNWYWGKMIPLLGETFFNRIELVWGIPLVSGVTASFGLFIIKLTLPPSTDERRSYDLPLAADEAVPLIDDGPSCERDFSDGGKLEQFNPRLKVASSFAVCILLLLMGVMLPAVRWRKWRNVSLGSVDRTQLLSVLTWNVQGGYSLHAPRSPLSGVGFVNLEDNSQVIREVKPHIVGLQESTTASVLFNGKDIVSYLSENLKLHEAFGAPAYIATPGVAMLTASELSDVKTTVLPRADGPMQRLLQYGKYKYNDSTSKKDHEIHVFNTHISAFSHKARSVQLESILEAVNKVSGPLVLVGDINAPPKDAQLLWKDGPLKLVQFSANPLDTASLPPTSTTEMAHIDHIYYRDLCLKEQRIIPVEGISDHLPVYATFAIPNADGSCP